MKFHILTLFPEMVLSGLHTSIIGRAAEKNIIEINAVISEIIQRISTEKRMTIRTAAGQARYAGTACF